MFRCLLLCCPETSSCASKPLLLQCKLVIRQCLYKVSLGLKEGQFGAHDFNLYMVPLFARKPGNINVSRSAAPKLAHVPASRYNCDERSHMLMSVLSFIRIERGSDGGMCPQT